MNHPRTEDKSRLAIMVVNEVNVSERSEANCPKYSVVAISICEKGGHHKIETIMASFLLWLAVELIGNPIGRPLSLASAESVKLSIICLL
jgi:hypothetical protein